MRLASSFGLSFQLLKFRVEVNALAQLKLTVDAVACSHVGTIGLLLWRRKVVQRDP